MLEGGLNLCHCSLARDQQRLILAKDSSISSLDILFEDRHLLVVNKPAGLVMARDGQSADTLFGQVTDYVKAQQQDGAKGYVSLIHFLDRNVSGCVLFAKSSKAATRMHKAFKERTIQKSYVAVVEGRVNWPLPQKLVDHLDKDNERNVVRVAASGKLCELTVTGAFGVGDSTVLNLQPKTGRSHQIRVQLSSRGHPILGDKKYGSTQGFPAGIALHAEALEFEHPVAKTMMKICAPRPNAWRVANIPESQRDEKTNQTSS